MSFAQWWVLDLTSETLGCAPIGAQKNPKRALVAEARHVHHT